MAKSSYDLWQEEQGVPTYRGYYIENLYTLELGPWPWLNGRGAIINLADQVTDDAWVVEIPSGGSLAPVRHMFEIQFFALAGYGTGEGWLPNQAPVAFEWGRGSLFSFPLNSTYRLHNGDGRAPARLFAVTSAPTMINLLRDRRFLFENTYDFADRFGVGEDYFRDPGKSIARRTWKTNLVPDIRTFGLEDHSARGKGALNMLLSMAANTMGAHISEFEVGMYKKAHRHDAGAHVVIISGEGYSLMWPPGSEPKRFDWQDGAVLSPPDAWFHQHMNLGSVPARYFALRWHSPEFPIRSWWMPSWGDAGGYEQIEYGYEAPRIRQDFEEELQRRGIHSTLPAPVSGSLLGYAAEFRRLDGGLELRDQLPTGCQVHLHGHSLARIEPRVHRNPAAANAPPSRGWDDRTRRWLA